MAEGDTLVNALLGAVVSVVLSFLPFSPLLGGAVAGYLEGGSREDGLRVGAISGIIALVPLAGIALFLVGILGVFLVGGAPASAGALAGIVFLFVLATVGVYTIGLSAIGGWLGNYVLTDTDVGHSSDGP